MDHPQAYRGADLRKPLSSAASRPDQSAYRVAVSFLRQESLGKENAM